MVYVALRTPRTQEKRTATVATDYDEPRSDVKETQNTSLEALQSANAPDARSVVRELGESDALDEAMTPGGDPQPPTIPAAMPGAGSSEPPDLHPRA